LLELEAYKVAGLRALLDTDWIPVRSPTILTGGNDGGKTTALDGLKFLLGRQVPKTSDYTVIGPPAEDGAEPLRAERVTVTARLSLDGKAAKVLGAEGESIEVRRTVSQESKPLYEIRKMVPADERLRALDQRTVVELRALSEEVELEPQGPKNRKASWLEPLEAKAEEDEQVEDWSPCPAEVVEGLPRCLVFSSTEEPAPTGQIKSALQFAYEQALESEEHTGPLRKAEERMRERLAKEASALCAHIRERCPELNEIVVEPRVAFSESFREVEVRTSRGSVSGIPLESSGAGRQRQVNLAIWEWVEKLIEEAPADGRGVVIAYDEPDTHLDYGHQRELVTVIQGQCKRTATRMLIATHSLNLIDRVDINDVVHLRLEDDRTQVDRLLGGEHEEEQRYLATVSAAMGLRNSVLLHERCFVGVEGPTETQAFPSLFELATGMSLASAGIALIAGNGNEGALRVAQFLREHERNLGFVVDRDSLSGDTRRLFRKEKLDEIGIPKDAVHYVGATEVEDLFSDEQWIATANKHWPRDDGGDWVLEHMGPVRLGSKFSAALANVMRGGSRLAPERKPGYLVALASTLREKNEVPRELREVFESLVRLAAEG
jgi:hypothetical protein